MKKKKVLPVTCLTLSIINFIMATIWIIVVATAMFSPNLDKTSNVAMDVIETLSIFAVLLANAIAFLFVFIHYKKNNRVQNEKN